MKNILWPPPPFFVVAVVVVENHERLSSRDIGWKLIMKIRIINPDDKTILRLHHEFIEPLSHPMKNPGYGNAYDHDHDVLSESFIFYNPISLIKVQPAFKRSMILTLNEFKINLRNQKILNEQIRFIRCLYFIIGIWT